MLLSPRQFIGRMRATNAWLRFHVEKARQKTRSRALPQWHPLEFLE
jgi:hypothetical protein